MPSPRARRVGLWGRHRAGLQGCSARRMRASPLCHRPESFNAASGEATPYTIGGSCRSAFQSVERRAVRVPESFRGGCSFGGRSKPALSRASMSRPF
ncbi:protein of unknown function [Methylorubrum extorquens]|uniref:Uncharacterized protein n=1 Tax=Methylorubrum extorquens TaxID=408 RepID=A0A2N9AZE0_METEX|nr:protein of unknown function [Methylorubrum extorquens]